MTHQCSVPSTLVDHTSSMSEDEEEEGTLAAGRQLPVKQQLFYHPERMSQPQGKQRQIQQQAQPATPA